MGSRYARLIWAAPLMAAVAATLTASGPPAADGPAVRSVSGRLDGEVSTVLIDTTEPVAYLTSQPDPLTVFVDLRNARAEQLDGRELGAMEPPVSTVRLESAMAPDGSPVARVRVALSRPAPHRVRSSRNLIYLEVDRDGVKAAAPAVPVLLRTRAAARPETAQEIAGRERQDTAQRLATRLTGVKPMALPDGTAIALSGNGRLVASRVEAVEDLPARVLLDFEGVGMGSVPPATLVDQGDVRRVRVGVNSTEPLITRVVIDLVKKLPYTVESVGEELRVLFARAAGAAASMVTPAAPARPEPVAETRAAVPEPVPVTAAPAVAPTTSRVATLPAARAPAPAMQAGQPAAAAAAPPRFTGHPVTFDFQGADLRAVLRTFAEISGLNVVIDPSIQGTVDVSLKEVPWDQALDIILKANKLGYAVDGTIVRIAPLSVLAQENEERRKLAEAEALAGSLEVMTRPLSYAKAADLVPIIMKSALSTRGDVQIDQRTNTLIIRDLPERLAAASELVTSLDSPQPQVEIEARIVQTSRNFARALGVQWGVGGRMDPALGNTTNLAFPNSAAVVGETRLPESGVTSALGIALGSINGALNLDVALTALETSGKGRILSTPRVSTQNNVEAEITQGQQIPIQTQANNTITVTFKDAALSLKVLPQITASGTVIMRVTLENAAADYNRSVNGIPPIDTQRAVTSVLVADGETTVIGGIYITNEQTQEGRTPLLNRIPLLGWLFKRDRIEEQNRELLIFITPRITKG